MMEIGVDIVKISRLQGKSDLAKKILSPEEWETYQIRLDQEQFLAGRFAAREAFVKAMKGRVGMKDFPNIRVLYDAFGAPYLMFEERKYAVSISHDGDYAIATVIVE